MSLIYDDLEYGRVNRVDQAIERIKTFDPLQNSDQPYYVAYSGGKDSDCIRILCELAGIKFDLVHNHTTVDAPATVRYIQSIPDIQISYPKISMWELIVKKKFPPTRIARYCCSELKERGGSGRFAMTGVRWDESNNRKKNRGSLELSREIILNADNADNRKLVENCAPKSKRILNPIVDWADEDVWEFLNYYASQTNILYALGFKRVGCVGCPMAGEKREKEFEIWPKYKENYIRAFQRMIDAYEDKPISWKTGEEVFTWWMNERNQEIILPGQMGFEDYI